MREVDGCGKRQAVVMPVVVVANVHWADCNVDSGIPPNRLLVAHDWMRASVLPLSLLVSSGLLLQCS